MNQQEVFRRIASKYPGCKPEITEFSSGAIMLDITIHGERYCAEYLPTKNIIGLSKLRGASPFWEGVERSFKSFDELEDAIAEIIEQQPMA